jgi:hypothetical protein
MMPVHCKDVAFKRVDFPLTEERIRKRFDGEKVFIRTEYFILENAGRYAVVKLSKKRGFELFRQVTGIEIVSLPEDTAFVNDPGCDVLNPHSMARHAVAHSQDTVVVLGAFGHISFVKGEKNPLVLRVIDVVPPFPSKTVEMVELALRMGAIRTPLLLEPVLVDAVKAVEDAGAAKADGTGKAAKTAPESGAPVVMFPCEAGHLEVGGRPVLYLDKTPPLPETEGQVTLVGCQLSMKIFRHTYGREPGFVNICPRDLAKKMLVPGKLHIARCCDVHRVRVEGDLALVQYGARMEEIVQAIRELTVEVGEPVNRQTGQPGGEPGIRGTG